MQVHLVSALALSLEDSLSLVKACIVSEVLGSIAVGIAKQPLQKDNVVLKHPS